MGATLVYIEEVVAEYIQCECGYESDKIEYMYGCSETHEQLEEWTCPECGETAPLEPDWRNG